jgi:nucleotide sugar dehydrogenase
MKVGIIGYGFVGKALADGFLDNVEILKIDPKLQTTILDLMDFNPDIIFICVPTPMNKDGSQDISILESVLDDIKVHCPQSLVVLKSTVLPSYISFIHNKFKSLVINPEFLRENFALEDFINSDLILFGGEMEDTQKISDFYLKYTKCKNTEHLFVDTLSASLIKYTINSFLATKVLFFNEVKRIFDKSGTDESWTNFIEAISSDKRIGASHMQVPGPDGREGFGGACFPKDTNALLRYSKEIGAEFNLLKQTISLNNQIRSEYNEPTNREIEQNIGFKKISEE